MRRWIHGTLLSISSRASLSSRETSPRRSALRTASIRRRITSCPGSAVARTQMPRITKVTTTKVRTKINAAIASPLKRSNVQYPGKLQNYLRLANLGFFEHRHWKRNPGNEQFFRELRANPRGRKFAKDFSVFTNATLAEDKYLLHGDHLALHAGN